MVYPDTAPAEPVTGLDGAPYREPVEAQEGPSMFERVLLLLVRHLGTGRMLA